MRRNSLQIVPLAAKTSLLSRLLVLLLWLFSAWRTSPREHPISLLIGLQSLKRSNQKIVSGRALAIGQFILFMRDLCSVCKPSQHLPRHCWEDKDAAAQRSRSALRLRYICFHQLFKRRQMVSTHRK